MAGRTWHHTPDPPSSSAPVPDPALSKSQSTVLEWHLYLHAPAGGGMAETTTTAAIRHANTFIVDLRDSRRERYSRYATFARQLVDCLYLPRDSELSGRFGGSLCLHQHLRPANCHRIIRGKPYIIMELCPSTPRRHLITMEECQPTRVYTGRRPAALSGRTPGSGRRRRPSRRQTAMARAVS